MKKKQRPTPMGPKAVRGSEAARRRAALMMEVWSGVRSAVSASEAMGTNVTRYYQLEARALQLIVSAMEPQPRGHKQTAETELRTTRREKQRLQREVDRYQSLYRTAQRALGVAVARSPEKRENPSTGGRRKRRVRKKARGESVAAVLLGGAEREATDGTTEQGPGPRGHVEGRRGDEVAAQGHPRDAVGGDARGGGV